MVKLKIANDIKKFLLGTREYNFIASGQKMLYPIDLDFTLDQETLYYSPKDQNGIPQKKYSSIGITYNPTRIAAYGLSHWNRYHKTENKHNINEFKKVLSWFINSNIEGKWYYSFNWDNLKAPWLSCMSQGEAISILVRGYLLTKKTTLLDIAILALRPFNEEIKDGGVLSKLNKDDIFFEEYPIEDSVHVLNGFLYSLIGIIELKKVISKDHKEYEQISKLMNRAVRSLEENIDRWDCGFWSTYDLFNEKGVVRNYSTISYHVLQTSQLRFVATELDSPKLLEVSQKWDKYIKSPINRVKALLGKSYFRYKNPVQR